MKSTFKLNAQRKSEVSLLDYFVDSEEQWEKVMEYGKDRNTMIELLRFFATINIAIFHFEWIYLDGPVYFSHNYLWVEFFFVLSGFFLAQNVKKAMNDPFASLKYTFDQAKKLWPPYIIAFVFSFTVYCIMYDIDDIYLVLNILWKSKWEMFYLQLSGFDPTAPVINGVTMYISVLLFAGLFIHYCLRNHYSITINLNYS